MDERDNNLAAPNNWYPKPPTEIILDTWSAIVLGQVAVEANDDQVMRNVTVITDQHARDMWMNTYYNCSLKKRKRSGRNCKRTKSHFMPRYYGTSK